MRGLRDRVYRDSVRFRPIWVVVAIIVGLIVGYVLGLYHVGDIVQAKPAYANVGSPYLTASIGGIPLDGTFVRVPLATPVTFAFEAPTGASLGSCFFPANNYPAYDYVTIIEEPGEPDASGIYRLPAGTTSARFVLELTQYDYTLSPFASAFLLCSTTIGDVASGGLKLLPPYDNQVRLLQVFASRYGYGDGRPDK